MRPSLIPARRAIRAATVGIPCALAGCSPAEPDAGVVGAQGAGGVTGQESFGQGRAGAPAGRALAEPMPVRSPAPPPSVVLDSAVDRSAAAEPPTEGHALQPPCPGEMVPVDTFCIDRFEAPNRAGVLPLVMYSFVEAASWCEARSKRLCFDDEWTRACGGETDSRYPYGDQHVPGLCNDARIWRSFDQERLDGWPLGASTPDAESLETLLEATAAVSDAGELAQAHVRSLYQADPSGARAGCVGSAGVYDLCGNVEEWTRRRDGGVVGFSGSLKGRYWAEPRSCASAVLTHGDQFRFYELGFRCCADP